MNSSGLRLALDQLSNASDRAERALQHAYRHVYAALVWFSPWRKRIINSVIQSLSDEINLNDDIRSKSPDKSTYQCLIRLIL